ncbi:hypothetical protein H4219_003622 [Mycoemilia scoparia]|uniref:RRM domain-containing protein n=1 Tax=Mycoemilia scoparia TaxID=417184 RepID=A0A9W7ZYD7_9FUNG|nr:hypothetical protein H4219_003622 [Mycoemilia scoparia]
MTPYVEAGSTGAKGRSLGIQGSAYRPSSRVQTPRSQQFEREGKSISLVPSTKPDPVADILEKFEACKLYFWGIAGDALPQLQEQLVAYNGIKLNVYPGNTDEYSGDVLFETPRDTEKAFACLNNFRFKDTQSTLYLSPLGVEQAVAETSNLKVRVNHIPENADTSTLYDFLRVIGPVHSCYVAKDHNGNNKDYAVGSYFNQTDVDSAVENLNFSEYIGSTVSLQSFTDRRPNTLRSVSSSLHSSATPATSSPRLNDFSQLSISTPTTESSVPATPSRLGAETPHQRNPRSSTPGIPGTPTPGQGLGGVIVPGKLFITNLHPTVSHSELFQLFKPFGFIHTARVSVDDSNKKSRGHGIVQFGNPHHAMNALNGLQGIELKGRKITIYQYEHVSKDGSTPRRPHTSMQNAHQQDPDLLPRPQSGLSKVDVSPSVARNSLVTPVPPSPSVGRAPSRFSIAEPPATPTSDPLLDSMMLENLSIAARSEVLTQKLIAQVSTNPSLDIEGAPEIIATLVKCEVGDVIRMINDSSFLESQWISAREYNRHSPPSALQTQSVREAIHRCDSKGMSESLSLSSQQSNQFNNGSHRRYSGQSAVNTRVDSPSYGGSPIKLSSSVKSASIVTSSPLKLAATSTMTPPNSAIPVSTTGGGDPETEEFIELLMSKPEVERKQKLGSKLFPLIKGLGFKDCTKLTVWILDNMFNDIHNLAYSMNDPIRLQNIAKEAEKALSSK